MLQCGLYSIRLRSEKTDFLMNFHSTIHKFGHTIKRTKTIQKKTTFATPSAMGFESLLTLCTFAMLRRSLCLDTAGAGQEWRLFTFQLQKKVYDWVYHDLDRAQCLEYGERTERERRGKRERKRQREIE